MSTCNRCGVGPWHPEAFACTHTDCAIRRAQALPAAAFPKSGGRPLAGDASTRVTGTFLDQRAGNREADGFRGEVERFPVHAEENACAAR